MELRSEFERRIEGIRAEVVDAIESGRRRQQAQMVRAFRQQSVNERIVDTVRRKHRVGDTLWRILVVVETSSTERQIEIGNNRIEREIAADGPCDIVCHGRSADAALGADDRDNPADRLGIRRREQAADRPHNVESANRADQVLAHAAPCQATIERDIIDAANDDHPGAGVAYFGQMIEPPENLVGTVIRLDQDDVRCR